MRTLGCLTLILVMVLLLAEVVLPTIFSHVVAERAPEVVRLYTGVALTPVQSVTVRSIPAAKILFGLVDRITIDTGPLLFAGYPVDRVRLDLREVRFVPASLRSRGNIRIIGRGDVTAAFTITQDSLNKGLSQVGLPVASPVVTLSEGSVRIGGGVSIAGVVYNAGFVGRLALAPSEPSKIYFIPDELDVNGQKALALLSGTMKRLIGERVLLVDLQKQGIPLVFTRVDVTRGQLTLVAAPTN